MFTIFFEYIGEILMKMKKLFCLVRFMKSLELIILRRESVRCSVVKRKDLIDIVNTIEVLDFLIGSL